MHLVTRTNGTETNTEVALFRTRPDGRTEDDTPLAALLWPHWHDFPLSDSSETLAALLLSEVEPARELAFSALQAKYGEDRGYDPRGEPAAMREAAARWME